MPLSAEILAPIREIQGRLDRETSLAGRKAILQRSGSIWLEAARQDPWFFMRYCLQTHDEHHREAPYEPFPNETYLKLLTREWERIDNLKELSKRVLFIPKSRKMMVSWFALAMSLWELMFREAALLGWQSQKAEDADKMLRKIVGLHERMVARGLPVPKMEGKYLELRFPETNAQILAIPAGGDQVRQYTWTTLTSDELAFQESARASYVAAMPAIEGGGKFIGISSAAPGFFEAMVGEKKRMETHRHLWTGMDTWETVTGVSVLRLHYSADPKKSPEWAAAASEKYPGGMQGADWQAEMEIDFGSRSGTLVFPEFSISTHVEDKPFEIPNEWAKFRVLDWGYQTATACLWLAIDGDANVFVYREHYQKGWEVEQHAKQIIALSGKEDYVCSFIDSATLQHSAGRSHLSVQELFARNRLFFSPAKKAHHKREMIPALGAWIKPRESGRPRLRIFNTCPNTIEELLKWRWQKLSMDAAETKDPREVPVDKDDHAIDSLLYASNNIDERHAARLCSGATYREVEQIANPNGIPRIRQELFEQVARAQRRDDYDD